MKPKTEIILTTFILLLDIWLNSQEAQGELTRCSENHYKCQNNQKCILDVFRCDGIADCPDKSDELNCLKCRGGSFTCKSRTCIPWKSLCDSQSDCPDKSDEIICNGSSFPTPPSIWTEPWLDRGENYSRLRLQFHDPHLALYSSNNKKYPITWPSLLRSSAWKYVTSTYGSFGPDHRLYVLLQEDRQLEDVTGSFWNRTTGYRNILYIKPSQVSEDGDAGWDVNISDNFKALMFNLVKVVRHGVKGTSQFADGSVCGKHIQTVLLLDIVVYLNRQNLTIPPFSESGVNSRHSCNDWYLTIYHDYGGEVVMNQYFTLTSIHWESQGYSSLNKGQLVHFWSGATGANLAPIARQVFNWTSIDDFDLHVAKQAMPFFIFPNSIDNSTDHYIPSRNFQKTWKDHNGSLNLVYADQHVAFYYQNLAMYNIPVTTFTTISSAWGHIKQTYGPYGENSTIHIVLRNNSHPKSDCFSSNINSYVDPEFTSRHVIDCPNTVHSKWVKPNKTIGAFDEIFNEIGQMGLKLCKGIGNWPGFNVSGWNMASILVYDMYLSLNRTNEAQSWKTSYKIDDAGKSWFKDWYLKIYEQYRGSSVINRYLSLVEAYLPHDDTDFAYQLNSGEYLHFWNQATGTNLLESGINVPDWDPGQNLIQFKDARTKFPAFNYSCSSCHDTINNNPGSDENTEPPQNPNKSDTNMIVVGVSASILFVVILGFGYKVLSYNKRIENMNLQIRSLTPAEVTEFMDGNQNVDLRDAHAPIHSLPFNPEFEVAQNRLVIDETLVLGSGEFGLVKKGILKTEVGSEEPDVVVAVKMVKPNVEVVHFKALLSEIKVMAHLGRHENIASLLGTLTQNIINCQIFIALEFCSQGDLLRYLKDNSDGYQNIFEAKVGRYSRCTYKNVSTAQVKIEPLCGGSSAGSKSRYVNSPVTTFDLLEWSRQIACGMAYLGSKHVIHGDLAARNVLLTENNVAKISDFGLSRQLVKYAIYARNPETPVPWRWLSPEALEKRIFSIHSDIWAFGVTLWEIFTLGKVPYSSRAWDRNFVNDLLDGERLSSPEFGNKEIYQIMLDCMKKRPTERITFTHISSKLQKITESLITTERNRHYLTLECSSSSILT